MDRRLYVPQRWLTRPIAVLLAGAGGSGSEMLDALCRIDVAHRALGGAGLEIAVYDPDTVSPFNPLRQRFLPCDAGQNKALLLAHRYGAFMGANVRGVAAPLTQEIVSSTACDLLVSAVDKAAVRAELGAVRERQYLGRNSGALWLDLGNGARDGQAVLGHWYGWRTNPDTHLPNVLDLYPEIVSDAEALDADDAPSCSAEDALSSQDLFINRRLAVHAADMLWTLLRRGSLDYHGLWVTPEGVTHLPIDPIRWASFGLVAEPDPTAHAA